MFLCCKKCCFWEVYNILFVRCVINTILLLRRQSCSVSIHQSRTWNRAHTHTENEINIISILLNVYQLKVYWLWVNIPEHFLTHILCCSYKQSNPEENNTNFNKQYTVILNTVIITIYHIIVYHYISNCAYLNIHAFTCVHTQEPSKLNNNTTLRNQMQLHYLKWFEVDRIFNWNDTIKNRQSSPCLPAWPNSNPNSHWLANNNHDFSVCFKSFRWTSLLF